MMSEYNYWMWVCPRRGVQRRGCHTGLSVLPQSRLEVSCCRWMCRASIVFLLEWLVSTCLTVAACQFTVCCLVHACTAMPFFHIVSFHCSFVFTYPLLQCSSCFSDIDTLAFGAWYLVHDTFLFPLWLGVFCFHQGLSEGSLRFEGCPDTQAPALPLYPLADPSHIR